VQGVLSAVPPEQLLSGHDMNGNYRVQCSEGTKEALCKEQVHCSNTKQYVTNNIIITGIRHIYIQFKTITNNLYLQLYKEACQLLCANNYQEAGVRKHGIGRETTAGLTLTAYSRCNPHDQHKQDRYHGSRTSTSKASWTFNSTWRSRSCRTVISWNCRTLRHVSFSADAEIARWAGQSIR
jgi:hypothetical protein